MTDIEQKALALVNEVRSEMGFALSDSFSRDDYPINEVLCRAIEQHEAFRQEVSDVASVCAQHFCENSWTVGDRQDHIDMLTQFIIPKPKPDPLVEVMKQLGWYNQKSTADFRASLDALGFEIREKSK